MTDTLPPIEDPTPARWRLESINPTMAIAGGLILLCLGIWVGFKVAGGEVVAPCPDCEKARMVAVEEPVIIEVPEEEVSPE